MNVFRRTVARSLVCIALPLAVASGQKVKSPAIDIGIEGWEGFAVNRAFSNNSGLAADAAATWHARAFPHGALIAGAGVAVQGLLAFGDRCLVSPGIPPIECAPDYPSFSSLTLLGGLESTLGLTARVVGGPAIFHAAGGTATGLQGRADLATPSVAHLSLVATARGAIIPSFRDHRYQMRALGVGLRIR